MEVDTEAETEYDSSPPLSDITDDDSVHHDAISLPTDDEMPSLISDDGWSDLEEGEIRPDVVVDPNPFSAACAALLSTGTSTYSPGYGTLPLELEPFRYLFDQENADTLPASRRLYDLTIDLIDDTTTLSCPVYNLSEPGLKTLHSYLDDYLAKGFIRKSNSPFSSPLMFVKKKDGSLRPCIDYRALNKITVSNRYPIPLPSQLIERLAGSAVFSKIDLRGAYNLVRVKPGDEWKTAFKTR
jgi:hypothetical protein